ncbi:MAG: S8 family serine peptidase, partial [Planctomycetota bacterium]
MRKRLITLLAMCLIFGLAENVCAGISADSGQVSLSKRAKWVPDEIIVKFRKGVSEDHVKRINGRHRTSVLYTSPFVGTKRIRVPRGKTAEQMVGIYNREGDVEYAELNYYAYALLVPNDPVYSYQWHFNNPSAGINIESVWDITFGDPNVIVAVLDTGVAYEDYPAPDHWHISSYQAYSGNSWWCGLDNPAWATPPGYGNGWKDYLQHSFDLTAAAGTVTFSYQYRHDLELTATVAYDEAFT